MDCMPQEDAFELNSYVESFLQEENTVVHENVFSAAMIHELLMFAKSFLSLPEDFKEDIKKVKWYRKGGIHRQEFMKNFSDVYVKPFLSRNDAMLIGDTAFCISTPPHDIHVDNRDFRSEIKNKKNIIGYKSVVIPLEIDTENYPFLYTANQYFYGPSTRFRNGCESIDNNDAECLRQRKFGVYFSYDYKKDGVKYLSDDIMPKSWYDAHIDTNHVPYTTFHGFTIEHQSQWKPGNMMVFDSSRIHFAENITKKNATYKIGISLNYGIYIPC